MSAWNARGGREKRLVTGSCFRLTENRSARAPGREALELLIEVIEAILETKGVVTRIV